MTNLSSKFFQKSSINPTNDAIAIMDYLTSPDSIDRMLIMADLGLPSLSGVVYELEKRFANCKDFPLHHDGINQNATNRQNIGRMIKFIMKEFGYIPIDGGLSERAKLRQFANSSYFSTAAIYKKVYENPNHSIQKKIL